MSHEAERKFLDSARMRKHNHFSAVSILPVVAVVVVAAVLVRPNAEGYFELHFRIVLLRRSLYFLTHNYLKPFVPCLPLHVLNIYIKLCHDSNINGNVAMDHAAYIMCAVLNHQSA